MAQDARFGAKWITDVNVSYTIAKTVRLTVGAANLFDVRPDENGLITTSTGSASSVYGQSPFSAAAGTPFKIVAATRGSGEGVAILVPPNSPIRTVVDLRGKQVIVSSARGSVAQFLLLGALREARVDPRKVTRVGPEVARIVVARENPELVAPSPDIVRELQHVADRFHAEGVLPAHVDVSSIVDTSIFAETESTPASN